MQVNGTLISTIQTKHLIRRENERNKLTKKKKKKEALLGKEIRGSTRNFETGLREESGCRR